MWLPRLASTGYLAQHMRCSTRQPHGIEFDLQGLCLGPHVRASQQRAQQLELKDAIAAGTVAVVST